MLHLMLLVDPRHLRILPASGDVVTELGQRIQRLAHQLLRQQRDAARHRPTEQQSAQGDTGGDVRVDGDDLVEVFRLQTDASIDIHVQRWTDDGKVVGDGLTFTQRKIAFDVIES